MTYKRTDDLSHCAGASGVPDSGARAAAAAGGCAGAAGFVSSCACGTDCAGTAGFVIACVCVGLEVTVDC